VSRSLFDEASADIDENLWVLSPMARTRIKSWFLAFERSGYQRGLVDGAKKAERETVTISNE
jgi:hypothetical protein